MKKWIYFVIGGIAVFFLLLLGLNTDLRNYQQKTNTTKVVEGDNKEELDETVGMELKDEMEAEVSIVDIDAEAPAELTKRKERTTEKAAKDQHLEKRKKESTERENPSNASEAKAKELTNTESGKDMAKPATPPESVEETKVVKGEESKKEEEATTSSKDATPAEGQVLKSSEKQQQSDNTVVSQQDPSLFKQSGSDKKWIVPEKHKKRENPVSADKESLRIGKSLYVKHCKSCHGKKGLGDGTKAAQLETPCGDFTTGEFQAQLDEELFYKTWEGRDDMPNFKKKIPDEEDIWHIVNYLRTLKNI